MRTFYNVFSGALLLTVAFGFFSAVAPLSSIAGL